MSVASSQSKLNLPIGLILCGGKSTRMGEQNKALVDFNGEPLLQRIKSRFEPQVQSLLLNVASSSSEYDQFDLEYCVDQSPDSGPLMGLASAFAQTQAQQHIALCPCDAPFLPTDLVSYLIDMMVKENADIVCPGFEGELQPTFALWNKVTAERVQTAAAKGVGGLKALYSQFEVATIDWPEADPTPFFNINRPEELNLALSYLSKGA